ncbi:MAG TPA: ABC transporter ATP-binding protein [Acidimicrobiia bacterium]|nr:ABC transporter ATP-binding protein [Acidimicrobiia bacterium]
MTDTVTAPVLKVENLETHFFTRSGVLHAVDDISFEVRENETLGIVGESGCGKSMTALSIMRLVPDPPGRIVGGKVVLDGVDLLGLNEREVEDKRGNALSMIFQEPLTALNPLFSIGNQLSEVLLRHGDMSRKEALAEVHEMLGHVGLPDPKQQAKSYPHQLSGGMRQRAMIAMALLANPRLLIADEPTTALDVTIQAQILSLMRRVQSEYGAATMMITHDLGVIAEMADRVLVMYSGRIVETAPVRALFKGPAHPYTLGLHHSTPNLHKRSQRLDPIRGQVPTLAQSAKIAGCKFTQRCAFATDKCVEEEPPLEQIAEGHTVRCWHYDRVLESQGRDLETPTADSSRGGATLMPTAAPEQLIRVENLEKHFPITKGVLQRVVGHVRAVDGISFAINRGETLGLVGESGCGKSTTGRLLMRLLEASSGAVWFEDRNLVELDKQDLRRARREMQIIFQDPYSSLHPRMTTGEIIGEPIAFHKLLDSPDARRERVAELMSIVGLPEDAANRYPHEFSGGQRQRIGIARGLSVNPKFVVCDEPVSALDVSVQAQVLNLLQDLQSELGLTYLFISHDLSVVRHITNRIAVMYLGRIVEISDTDPLFINPMHPYTEALLSAIVVPDPEVAHAREQIILQGDIPSPANPPKGCNFHPRCPYAEDRCRDEDPDLRPVPTPDGGTRMVACHFAEELSLTGVK